MTWANTFIGDAVISVSAVGCSGAETGQRSITITVNEFDAVATQPTEPIPFLEAQQQLVTFSGVPVTGEKYSVFLNGIEYAFTTTDLVLPSDAPGVNGVDQSPQADSYFQMHDNTSLVKDFICYCS